MARRCLVAGRGPLVRAEEAAAPAAGGEDVGDGGRVWWRRHDVMHDDAGTKMTTGWR
jgi:hypothetical protein